MTPFKPLDPTDPRTPAFAIWAAAGDVRLIWRKATNEYCHSVGRPRFTTSDALALELLIGPNSEYSFERMKSAAVTESFFRAALVGTSPVSTRINDLVASRAINSYRRTSGRSLQIRGGQLNVNETSYRRIRQDLREWQGVMNALATAQRDVEVRDALGDIVYAANEDSEKYRPILVAAANAITGAHGIKLVHAGCGHVEFAGDIVLSANRNSYCAGCGDDLINIDDELYERDDCYHWESDDEYHLSPEPEDDDDDDDDDDDSGGPRSSLIRSWSTPTDNGVLDHEQFRSSALGDFVMGVELEVECSRRDAFADAVRHTHEHFNQRISYAMFKRDGSLGDYGFEVVTAARRLDEHLEMFNTWLPHGSLSAWNPGTCGVHVHVDSRAFTSLSLGKFLMFINDARNTAFIKALAGRHPSDGGTAASYCAAQDQLQLSSPLKALKGGHPSRYRMVNLCNLGYDEADRLGADTQRDCKGDYSTVELRIFRASLKKERLLAQIEFSHAAVMFCRTASWGNLTSNDFIDWLQTYAGRYKNLARWFGINVPKANKVNPAPALAPADETC